MAIQWFYQTSNDRASPPVDSTELRRLAEAGIVRPSTLVRQGDSGHWVRADQVRDLFQCSTPAPSLSPRASQPPPPLAIAPFDTQVAEWLSTVDSEAGSKLATSNQPSAASHSPGESPPKPPPPPPSVMKEPLTPKTKVAVGSLVCGIVAIVQKENRGLVIGVVGGGLSSVIGTLAFFVGLVTYSYLSTLNIFATIPGEQPTATPGFSWALMVLGVVLVVVGLTVFAVCSIKLSLRSRSQRRLNIEKGGDNSESHIPDKTMSDLMTAFLVVGWFTAFIEGYCTLDNLLNWHPHLQTFSVADFLRDPIIVLARLFGANMFNLPLLMIGMLTWIKGQKKGGQVLTIFASLFILYTVVDCFAPTDPSLEYSPKTNPQAIERRFDGDVEMWGNDFPAPTQRKARAVGVRSQHIARFSALAWGRNSRRDKPLCFTNLVVPPPSDPPLIPRPIGGSGARPSQATTLLRNYFARDLYPVT